MLQHQHIKKGLSLWKAHLKKTIQIVELKTGECIELLIIYTYRITKVQSQYRQQYRVITNIKHTQSINHVSQLLG